MWNEEYIICSAIWYEDGIVRVHQPKNVLNGLVVCGRRHHNCFNTVYELKDKSKLCCPHTEGFVTSKDRFVDRYEGAKIAFVVGQIDTPIEKLHSEDLY